MPSDANYTYEIAPVAFIETIINYIGIRRRISFGSGRNVANSHFLCLFLFLVTSVIRRHNVASINMICARHLKDAVLPPSRNVYDSRYHR